MGEREDIYRKLFNNQNMVEFITVSSPATEKIKLTPEEHKLLEKTTYEKALLEYRDANEITDSEKQERHNKLSKHFIVKSLSTKLAKQLKKLGYEYEPIILNKVGATRNVVVNLNDIDDEFTLDCINEELDRWLYEQGTDKPDTNGLEFKVLDLYKKFYVNNPINKFIRFWKNHTHLVEINESIDFMNYISVVKNVFLKHNQDPMAIHIPVEALQMLEINPTFKYKTGGQRNLYYSEVGEFMGVKIFTNNHLPNGEIIIMCEDPNPKFELSSTVEHTNDNLDVELVNIKFGFNICKSNNKTIYLFENVLFDKTLF